MILPAVKMHGKTCFSIASHENHKEMQAPGHFAIGTILPAVKMYGKTCFSTVPHEKHVKMQAPGLSPRHPWGTDLGCFGGPQGVVWGSFGTPKRPPGISK